ncbi:hypothetical protein [uncultured Nostoc sp.]|uniref:hypothetical protein n=1 Tax=uncultured Nostoc sp. TaxID=340711 RepID=UPI0035CC07F3
MAHNLVERCLRRATPTHFGTQGENDYLCGIANLTAIFTFTVLWLETSQPICESLKLCNVHVRNKLES